MTLEVIVGNIGTVASGEADSLASAEGAYHVRVYNDYVERSKSGIGRAGNESVVLMVNGAPYFEHYGTWTEVADDDFEHCGR